MQLWLVIILLQWRGAGLTGIFRFRNGVLIHSECPQARDTNIRCVVDVQNGCRLRSWNAEESISVSSIESPLSWGTPQSPSAPRGISRRPLYETVGVEERDKRVSSVRYQDTLEGVGLGGRGREKMASSD